MVGVKKNFTPEFRDEASREVVDNSRSIVSVARGIGVSETTLGNWVRAYRERHAGEILLWKCPSGRGSARPSGKSGNYGRKSLSWKK